MDPRTRPLLRLTAPAAAITATAATVVAVIAAGLVTLSPAAHAAPVPPADPGPQLEVLLAGTDTQYPALAWRNGSLHVVDQLSSVPDIVSVDAAGAATRTDLTTPPGVTAWDPNALAVGADGTYYLAGSVSVATQGVWDGVTAVSADGSTVHPAPAGRAPYEHVGGVVTGTDDEGADDKVIFTGFQYDLDHSSTPFIGYLSTLPLPLPADESTPAVIAGGPPSRGGSCPAGCPVYPIDIYRADGDLYVTDAVDSDRVLVFDALTGAARGTLGKRSGPSGYSSDPGARDGLPAATSALSRPTAVAVDHRGNVFVAVSGGDVLYEITSYDGVMHWIAGGGDDAPSIGADPRSLDLNIDDLAIDDDHNLYLASTTTDSNNDKHAVVLKLPGIADPPTPDPPTGLSVAPGDGSATATFTAPAVEGESPVTGYLVTALPQGGGEPVSVRGARSPIQVTGLTDGTSYDVMVQATNASGDGPPTQPVTVTPRALAAHLSADVTTGTAPLSVELDAGGSVAPPGATFQFYCGDSYDPLAAPSTSTHASCSYRRGSPSEGWRARVVMHDPATGSDYEDHAQITVSPRPNTVESSAAFDPAAPDATAAVAGDGSLTSATCGPETTGVTCVQVEGVRIKLAAGAGTFEPGTTVQVYIGDNATLQQELDNSHVQVQGGVAVTWTPHRPLAPGRSLVVTVPDQAAAAGQARHAGRATSALAFDVGSFLTGLGDAIVGGATRVVQTVGANLSAAANAVSSWWSAAVQSLTRPNDSATNDVLTCASISRSGDTTTCQGPYTWQKDVPTEAIMALDAGSHVIAAGGGNVIAAGGGNVIAAGGGNVIAAGGGNLSMTFSGDPGMAFLSPDDTTPPTVTATLDPAPPPSGVYPEGTQVAVHLHATSPADPAIDIKRISYSVNGAQSTPYTIAAGDSAEVVVDQPGTSTITYGAQDANLNDAAPQTLVVEIAQRLPAGAPTGVGASRVDNESATVTWTVPDDLGTPALTGYAVTVIDQGTIADGEDKAADRVQRFDTTDTSQTVTGLTPGHAYVFTVAGFSGTGEQRVDGTSSTPSEPVNTATVPSAPRDLSATPGDGEVALTWEPPTDQGGLDRDAYLVYRSTSAAGPWTLITPDPTGQPADESYLDGSVLNGTAYFYAVTAENALGESPASESAGPITPSRSTTTSLVATPNPASVGEPVTWTATVSPAPSAGTVEFAESGTPLAGCAAVPVDQATGEASCQITYPSTGSHPVVARYTGAGGDLGSTSAVATAVVDRADQTIDFAAPAALTYGDAAVRLSGSASSGLAVSFSSTTPAVCTVSNDRLQVLHAGSCTVTVSQAGDASYQAADPVISTLTIAKARLTVAAPDASMTVGGTPPPLEPVYRGFVHDETPVVLDVAPVCTAHPDTVTTSCSGGVDDDYAFSYQDGALTLTSAGQTITISAPAVVTYADRSVAVSATDDSGLPARLHATPARVCSIAAGRLLIHHAGVCVLTAARAGDGAHDPVTATRRVSVHQAPLEIRATSVTWVRGRGRPAVEAVYRGLVRGDSPFVLTRAPRCRAPRHGNETTCKRARDDDYAISYRPGKVRRVGHKRYAIVSAARAYARAGRAFKLRLEVVGPRRARISLRGGGSLSPGLKVKHNKAWTKVTIKGTPRATGTAVLRVSARVQGQHGKAARQRLVLAVY